MGEKYSDSYKLQEDALKNSYEGQMTAKNLEVAVIKTSDPEKSFHILTQSEIVDLLKEVEWTSP